MSTQNEAADLSDSGAPEPPSGSIPPERPGKPGGKRDQNRRERVAGLLESAIGLFLERGIEATTIDDITRGAGVAKGSFYRYFETKDALVEHMFAPVYDEVTGALERCGAGLKDARTRESMMAVYRDLGGEMSGTLLRYSELVLLYLQESRAPGVGARASVRALSDRITESAIELTHLARTWGLMRDFPAALSALTVVGAAERILFQVLTEGDTFFEREGVDPLTVPEALTSLVLDGLLAKPVRD